MSPHTLDRIGNASNRFQGDAKRVLCVCSGGLLRSPTAAHILASPPFNYNTRCAGINPEYALTVVDDPLLHWAQEIVVMEKEHRDHIYRMLSYVFSSRLPPPIIMLEIPDNYAYRDARLVELITKRYKEKVRWTAA